MRSGISWRLLSLLLACLLAAAHAGATPKPGARAAPVKLIDPNRWQWVQVVFTVNAKTCSALPGFEVLFREAFRKDMVQFINDNTENAAIILPTIGDNGLIQPCADNTYLGVNYANLRAALRFRKSNYTLLRDAMKDAASYGICKGRYRQPVYANIKKLMASNGLVVAFNNGSKLSPELNQNTNWVPVVSPSKCIRQVLPSPSPSIPSPSPAATIPSPSPAGQITPSPSPAPPPVNCASIPNSELQADGTCKCTKPGYTRPGYNGDSLVSCIDNSFSLCPAPTTTAVRDNSQPVPLIVSCITPATPCPAAQPFPLYGENQARDECRPTVVDCTYTPYTMKITDINGTQLLGCVNPYWDVCPFVAFREADDGYRMDACKKTDFCPTYSESPPMAGITNTRYTTAGRAADRTLTACLTLPADNTCPTLIPTVNYPIEVVAGVPRSCGADSAPCEFGNASYPSSKTRVAECLAFGGACDPAAFPLQLFNNPGVTGSRPVVVECRQARPGLGLCDLTFNGMGNTTKDPNAAAYTIPVYQTQGNLVGCMFAGATACPAAYPVAVRDTTGALKECRQFTDSSNPCIGNSAQPVPAMAADGTWLGICLERKSSCEGTYATLYGTPVTIRNKFGEMIQCRGALTSCPKTPVLDTDGVTTLVPSFPLYKVNTVTLKTVIASCYPATAVGDACTIDIDSANYRIPIRSNVTGTLFGCIATGTTACPAEYPFAYMRCNTLLGCSPLGERTQCEPGQTPATFSAGYLVGCFDLTCSSPKRCPSGFPTTVAVGINQDALECMAENSRCYLKTQPFALYEEKTVLGVKFLELTWCINPQQSITNCDQADPAQNADPAVANAWKNAGEVYNNAGTSIIGCIKLPNANSTSSLTTCPPEAPFAFKFLDNSIFQCREGISPAPDCRMAVFGATAPPGIADFVVNILSGSTIVGCTQRGGQVCQTDSVIVSETAFSATEACLGATITSCTGISTITGQDRSFPIYSGTKADGTAKLVRCIKPIASTNCLGSAVDGPTGPSYTVPVFATTSATGNVVACMQASSEVRTPCPPNYSFPLVDQGPTSPLAACIPNPGTCNATAPFVGQYPSYSIPLLLSDGSALLGCMKTILAAPATACPVNPPSPYNVPFPVRNADGSIRECRTQTVNLTSCTGFGAASVPAYSSANLSDTTVTSCIVPGVFPAKCEVPGSPVAFYNSAGTQVQCRPLTVQCDPLGSNGFETRYTNNGVLEACVDNTNARRRSRQLMGSGNFGGNSNGCSQIIALRLAFWANGSLLAECAAGYSISTCNSLGSVGNGYLARYSNYTVELAYNLFNSSTVEGCLESTASQCPSKFIAPLSETADYPNFVATESVGGSLITCFEQSACAGSPCGPASFATCANATVPAGYTCNVVNVSSGAVAATAIVSRSVMPFSEKCVSSNSTAAGLLDCKGDTSQLWVMKNDSTISLYNTNNCLTADLRTNPAPVLVSSCNATNNGTTFDQYWKFDASSRLHPLSAPSLCVIAVSPSSLVTGNCTNVTSLTDPQVFRANLPVS